MYVCLICFLSKVKKQQPKINAKTKTKIKKIKKRNLPNIYIYVNCITSFSIYNINIKIVKSIGRSNYALNEKFL